MRIDQDDDSNTTIRWPGGATGDGLPRNIDDLEEMLEREPRATRARIYPSSGDHNRLTFVGWIYPICESFRGWELTDREKKQILSRLLTLIEHTWRNLRMRPVPGIDGLTEEQEVLYLNAALSIFRETVCDLVELFIAERVDREAERIGAKKATRDMERRRWAAARARQAPWDPPVLFTPDVGWSPDDADGDGAGTRE